MKPLLISILLLLFLHGGFAQDEHPIDKILEECIDNSKCITSEMVRCGEEASVSWEAEMDKYYNLLLDILDEDDKEKLKQSQSAWMRFKEIEFEFIPCHYTDPGSYQGPTTTRYKMNIIETRALQLQGYYEQAKKGRELLEEVLSE